MFQTGKIQYEVIEGNNKCIKNINALNNKKKKKKIKTCESIHAELWKELYSSVSPKFRDVNMLGH